MSLFRRVTDPEFPVKTAFSRWTIFTSFACKTPGVAQDVRDRELGKTPSCGRERMPAELFWRVRRPGIPLRSETLRWLELL